MRLAISRKTFYKWKNRFAQAKGDRSAFLGRSRWPSRPSVYENHGKLGTTNQKRERRYTETAMGQNHNQKAGAGDKKAAHKYLM